jgi:uncharacterized protein (TIRG00374 family)
MVGLQAMGWVFYAGAWYVLIRALGYRFRFVTCEGITFASIFVNYVTPSGFFLETVRCILGAKFTGMRFGQSTATIILHRILYIVVVLESTAVAVVALLANGLITGYAIMRLAVALLIAIGTLVLMLYFSLSPHRLQPLLDKILKLIQPLIKSVKKQADVEEKTDRFLEEYHISFSKMLSSGGLIALSFVVSLGDWTCSVVVLWVALLGLKVYVSVWVVVITMAVGEIADAIPVGVPGMLGIYEATITASLSLFSVPLAIAASAALLTRVITSTLELPVTGVAAYHYGFRTLGNRLSPLRVGLC